MSEHPYCCFCGGTTLATTEDHQPGRTFFRHNQFPNGYRFPACWTCNNATAHDELIASWIARVGTESNSDATLKEFGKLMASIHQNFPGLLESMRATDAQRLRALALPGLEMPPGSTLADVPVMNAQDPRVQNAVINISRKLALALYYKAFGEALPIGGAVAVRWYSNYQVEQGDIPRELAEITPNIPPIEWNRTPLREQFFYRIGVAKEGEQRMAVFLAFFPRDLRGPGVHEPGQGSAAAGGGIQGHGPRGLWPLSMGRGRSRVAPASRRLAMRRAGQRESKAHRDFRSGFSGWYRNPWSLCSALAALIPPDNS